MNIILKNRSYPIFVICHYISIIVGISIPFLEPNIPYASDFNMVCTYIIAFTAFSLGIVGIPFISIKLEVNDVEIKETSWSYSFSSKQVSYKIKDLEKIELGYSVFNKSHLLLFFLNGETKKIRLGYYDSSEGCNESVSLKQGAPGDANLLMGVRLAKTISTNSQIKFNTTYLE
jgi:hypothetical protein